MAYSIFFTPYKNFGTKIGKHDFIENADENENIEPLKQDDYNNEIVENLIIDGKINEFDLDYK